MKHIKEKSRTRQQRQRMRAHRRSMVLISSVIMLLIVLVSVGGVSLRAKNEAYKKATGRAGDTDQRRKRTGQKKLRSTKSMLAQTLM